MLWMFHRQVSIWLVFYVEGNIRTSLWGQINCYRPKEAGLYRLGKAVDEKVKQP